MIQLNAMKFKFPVERITFVFDLYEDQHQMV